LAVKLFLEREGWRWGCVAPIVFKVIGINVVQTSEYLDRQTRPSGTGCLFLFLLLAGAVYVMIHTAH
jgi:hypothetical protein